MSESPQLPVTDWELREGDMEAIKETARKIVSAME
jgi:hypothetical protein